MTRGGEALSKSRRFQLTGLSIRELTALLPGSSGSTNPGLRRAAGLAWVLQMYILQCLAYSLVKKFSTFLHYVLGHLPRCISLQWPILPISIRKTGRLMSPSRILRASMAASKVDRIESELHSAKPNVARGHETSSTCASLDRLSVPLAPSAATSPDFRPKCHARLGQALDWNERE